MAVTAEPMRVTAAIVVSDLTTKNAAPLDIAGVHVVPAHSGAEPTLERAIPGAGYAIERDLAIASGVGGEFTAVLLATEEAQADFDDVALRARIRVRQVLNAIRLTTGTTSSPTADIVGHPTATGSTGPDVRRLPNTGGWLRSGLRNAEIDQAALPALERMVQILAEVTEHDPGTVVSVALGRLARLLNEPNRPVVDQVVDLAVGLEATLAGTTNDTEAVSLRFRTRGCRLLAAIGDPPEAVYDDIKALYGVRSAFVHGSVVRPEKLSARMGKVNAALLVEMKGEQQWVAIDRWRDLLRRAILMRIALGSEPSPPWPFKEPDGFDADRVMIDPKQLRAWRQHVRSYWRSQGLEKALRPPAPLGAIYSRRDALA
jgi:hypothetical protein